MSKVEFTKYNFPSWNKLESFAKEGDSPVSERGYGSTANNS